MALLVGARVYNSGNISINNTTLTALTFDSERYDYDTIHSTVSNTGRLTATTAGIYIISASVEWGAGTTGYRQIAIRLNGATQIATHVTPASAIAPLQTITTIYQLAASDYVEVVVYHNQGSPVNIVATGNRSPEFSMQRSG